MAPFHPTGQNPTLALERDLDLIEHLDRLGFHEVWIGEHHSGGYEIIASPEVFIAVGGRTHEAHPARQRRQLAAVPPPAACSPTASCCSTTSRAAAPCSACGPGQLTSDAHMLGIPADRQRPRMDEALDAIMALLRGETVTMETDWFTLQDARLQLSRTATRTSKSRSRRRSRRPARSRPGKHGVGTAVDRGDRRSRASTLLGTHWQTWNEVAAEHGHTGRPREVAARRPDAPRRDEGAGARATSSTASCRSPHYFTHVLPAGPVRGDTARGDHRQRRRGRVRGHRHARRRDRARSRSSSTAVAAASAPSCCSATTGRDPPRRSAASNCSRST